MGAVTTLVVKPISATVKGFLLSTALATSPFWMPVVLISTMIAMVALTPLATLGGVVYVLWQMLDFKTFLTGLVTIFHELFSASPGLIHREDKGPPTEKVDKFEAGRPPKIGLVETPRHEEVTREYIRPYSPQKEQQERREDQTYEKSYVEEALVKRPVSTVREYEAPKRPRVDKDRVIREVYYLEEFVGLKDPSGPPRPGPIRQQIDEIAQAIGVGLDDVNWGASEDENYEIAAKKALPKLHDYIGV